MANPLNSLKNLKPWQQGLIAAGGIGVVGLVVWQHQKSKKAAAAAAAAAAPAAPASAAGVDSGVVPGTSAGQVQDPTTGTDYPDTEIDPQTGITYAQEIAEYGSVSAAETAANNPDTQAALQGETPQEYDQQTDLPTGGGTSGQTVATNAEWMAEVETGLSEVGYSSGDIGQALSNYFAKRPLGITSDGTSLYTIMNLAVSEYGPPPVGSYPLLNGTGNSNLPGTGTPNITVPDVVGRTDLDTAEGIITKAGLVPHAAGNSGAGNKGKVTSQDPKAGSVVDKGSAVTLTYTVDGKPPVIAGQVDVPNVVGRTDLSTAEGIIRSAGLSPKTTGVSGVGNKGSVTAQDPKAGTKVDKGSNVTLTYTVKK